MRLNACFRTSTVRRLVTSDRCLLAGSDATHTQPPPTDTLASELPHIAAPLIPFLTFCPTQDAPGLTNTHLSPHQNLGGSQSPRQPHISTLVAQESQLDAESAAALALPPVLQPRHRMYQLSEKGILEMTGVSLLGMLTQLNLHGSALKRIEVSCSTLRIMTMTSVVLLNGCMQRWTDKF